jgi:hypothetical protein
MINYEHGMLVLNSAMSKSDAKAINDFLEKVKRDERQRILNEINSLEEQSHRTRTPLYQETIFSHLKDILV